MARLLLTFEPPDGGVAEHVLPLALALPERGFDVELAGPLEAPLVYDQIPSGTPVQRIDFRRGYGDPRADLAAGRALTSQLRHGGYDLVHAHSAKAGVLARAAQPIARVPTVYSPHCFPFIGDFSAKRRIFATGVERALARRAVRTICVCDDEREVGIAAHLPADRLRVVHNGSATIGEVTPDPELVEFRGDGLLLASVAVLRPQKRVDVLIDAAPAILAANPRARVAIVGNGPDEAELRARASKLGLDDEPRFRFFAFRPPAAAVLRALDLYVLPSSWEAFPIGVLEAMAAGTPQLATDVGGTREAIVDGGLTGAPGETGVLVPAGDPARLAQAAIALLGDDARRSAMGPRAKARHDERFTLSGMADGIAAVYREVLASA